MLDILSPGSFFWLWILMIIGLFLIGLAFMNKRSIAQMLLMTLLVADSFYLVSQIIWFKGEMIQHRSDVTLLRDESFSKFIIKKPQGQLALQISIDCSHVNVNECLKLSHTSLKKLDDQSLLLEGKAKTESSTTVQ